MARVKKIRKSYQSDPDQEQRLQVLCTSLRMKPSAVIHLALTELYGKVGSWNCDPPKRRGKKP